MNVDGAPYVAGEKYLSVALFIGRTVIRSSLRVAEGSCEGPCRSDYRAVRAGAGSSDSRRQIAWDSIVPGAYSWPSLLAKDGKITIQDKDGNSEVFAVSVDAKITLDGKSAKLEEIANGNVAKVTVKTVGEKKTAIAIEAKGKE